MADFDSIAAAHDAAENGEPVAPDTVPWFDADLRLVPEIPPVAFLRIFAARSDVDAQTEIFRLLRLAIDPRDWQTFEDLAEQRNAGGDEMLELVNAITEGRGGRPTKQPSGSSDGSSTTSPTSTPTSARTEAPLSSQSTEERVAADLGIPLPPESRPDLRAALRLVAEPMPIAETG